ncbi:MAG: SusC/RagA family TonB-linked outer membrane protein [Rikenellaceae bacterium]|nr:SusC/RagA family TonB-linked outer membrane protein [Rikenellaceae bacterium]MCL2692143.1 SusC/RagA family TonB-linked outer membrane protein [Rikenellaceae bacterium]
MIRVKIALAVMFFCASGLNATVWSQAEKMTIRTGNVSMVEMFDILQRNTNLRFVFSYDDVARYSASVDVADKSLGEILDMVFTGTPLRYEIAESHVIVSAATNTAQQQQPAAPQRITIRGRVTGPDERPVIGAAATVRGMPGGTATDANGQFTLTFTQSADNILIVRFLGLETVEMEIGSRREFDIRMHEAAAQVGEVVVTGIFTRDKESFTGSSNRITNEELMRMSAGNVLRAVQMVDPGFRMNVSNVAGSNPNAIPDFEMRGRSNMGDYNEDDMVLMRGDIDTRPNQPLFVLDGIIGVNVTTIIDLDPTQVESITLLKDAAAMVIYGSRASNGVVVVETRAPERGNLRLSYSGNYMIQMPDLTVYDLLDARDKLELERRAGFYNEFYTAGNAAALNNYYLAKYMDVQRGVDTYWLNEAVRTAFSHRHGVNLEGGDNTIRYKLYFGANQRPGVMKGTGTDQKSGSIDLRYRRNKLLVSNQFGIDGTVGDRTSPYGSFREYTFLNPYYRKYDEHGGIIRMLDNFTYLYDERGNPLRIGSSGEGGGTQRPAMNPMYNTLYNQKDRSTTLALRNAFRAEYTPMHGLRLSTDITFMKSTDEVDIFLPAQHSRFQNETMPERRGSYTWNRTNASNLNVSFTASYNTMFGSDHLLSAFARYEMDERRMHMTSVEMRGFPNDKMDEVFLGSVNERMIGNEGKTRSLGLVSTVSYSFRQKYAADFSVRVDASSEFGRNNRFAPFWSGGVRWNMHREDFITGLNFFDELVLRTTYGITGSQGFSPYQSLQMYTYEGMMRIYHSSPFVGTILRSLGNPDLRWQQTQNFNAGLDFNMWNRILSGRFEYYRKYTINTLLAFSLAPSVGFETITDNMGNISNNGYEATLRVMPYNNVAQRLNFSIVANGSHNRNRIEKISNALKVRNQEAADRVESRPLPRYEEGYSQSMIWAVPSLGIDPISGREVYLKRDGGMTYRWNSLDQVAVGDLEPTLRGTVGFNLNWRGLSVNVAGGYQFGGQIYNRTLLEKVENANLRFNVDRRAFTERWHEPGDVTLFRGITTNVTGTSTQASSRFVMNNNEFMLSTMTVMYRMDRREHKFLERLGLSAANVAFYFEDLLRVSTVKMERGIDYPFAHQVSMSLGLTF